MMLNKKIIIFFLFITGLHAEQSNFSQEKNNIKIYVRQLTKTNMRQLFNCYNPIKIVRLTNHYKALEITIENKTSQDYVLERNNINLKLENKLIITSKIKTSPILIPIVTGIVITTLLISGLGLATLPSVIAGTTIGVTTLNLNMHKSNTISTKNIQTKVLDMQHPTLIPSYSKIQNIIFVTTKNTKNNFTLSLESLDSTQKTTFNIKI